MTLKKGRLKEIVKELQGASKMHLKQSEEIAAHIDDMESPTKMVSPLNFPGANSSNSSCWDGYRKDGVQDSPSGTGETVNKCVEIGSPAKQEGKYKPEEQLLDSDNPSGYSQGNRSDIQVDKKGQYVTSLGDNESRPDVNNDYTRPTSNSNEIDGIVKKRDTIRPTKGKVFKSKHNKKDLKKKLWVQGDY